MRLLSKRTRSRRVLNRALGTGVLPRMRPDKSLRARAMVRRWGLTPAAAYGLAAIRYPHEPAIIDERGTLTFAEVDRRTAALACSLQHTILPGDTVAVICRNHSGFVEATVACSKLGANILYLEPDAPSLALTRSILEGDPVAVVHDEQLTTVISPLCRGRRQILGWCEGPRGDGHLSLEDLICSNTHEPSQRRHAVDAGTVTLAAPGGARTASGRRVLPSSLTIPGTALSRIPLRTRERIMIAAPMCSRWGFLHFTLGMRMASTLVLHRQFDPVRLLADVQKHRVGALAVTRDMLERVAGVPDTVMQSHERSTLRVIAVPSPVIAWEVAAPVVARFGDILHDLHGPAAVRLNESWAREHMSPSGGARDIGGRSVVGDLTAAIRARDVRRSTGLSPGG